MVGELIQRRRRALRWSQQTLADKMGWKQTYLSRVERGEVAVPKRDALERLAGLLGVPLGEFYRAAGMLEGLPDAVMPPAALHGPTVEDKPWDRRRLVAWVEEHPDEQFRRDLAEDAEYMSPEDYEAYCLEIARAWLANGKLAQRIARLHRGPRPPTNAQP